VFFCSSSFTQTEGNTDMKKKFFMYLVAVLCFLGISSVARAQLTLGTSFADTVVSYTPAAGVVAPCLVPNNALGAPDYVPPVAECVNYVALGDGGSLVLKFTDNYITTGDGDDLWIFEVGVHQEPTDVYIRQVGEPWLYIGTAGGGTVGMDIDGVPGVVPEGVYRFVKLVDLLPAQSAGVPWLGADIDAVKTARPYPCSDWLDVDAGALHSVGIKMDGSLWTWGNNTDGQLGNGTTTDKHLPTRVGLENDWVAIAAGYDHNAALKMDGSLWTWGNNANGQLGDGTTTNKNVPTRVGLENNWESIAAGGYHTMAIKFGGSLWTWGANGNGQLGDGSSIDKNTPTLVGNDWLTVAGGGFHTLALKTNETLWTWGYNGDGQLGDGSSVDRNTPTEIGAGWIGIAGGGYHSLGIQGDGTLWTWGSNVSGQLGNGTTGSGANTPSMIGEYFTSIDGGEHYSLAVGMDGSLWAWGANYTGQLGDGTTILRNSPTMIGVDYDWGIIATGLDHSLSLKVNASLWAWGSNSHGQLGDGTTIPKNSPIKIQDSCDACPDGVCGAINCDIDNPTADDANCNGIDDDCDGLIDEDYVPTLTNCGTGSCGTTGMTVCIEGNIFDSCIPDIPQPETCGDGIDQDCDGSDVSCNGDPITTINTSISTPDDDAEEYWNCGTFNDCTEHPNGRIKLASHDLDMGHQQIKYVGLRFQNMSIPSGAVITNAYVTFVSNEANANVGNVSLRIRCEDADNTAAFNDTPFNIGNRSKTSADTFWSPGAWALNSMHQTPNFASSVQEVVNRIGWNSGNAITVLITRASGDGSGDDVRAAVSHDKDPSAAAVLHIEYQYTPGTIEASVGTSSGDSEEYWNCNAYNNCAELPDGHIKLASSDLDMGHPQMKYVGIRFENLNIPQGVTVTNAYLELVSNETNSGNVALRIRCEDADSSAPFSNAPFNIGNRSKTSAETIWSPGAWIAGSIYQTDNFAPSFQEVVDRGGWNPGNALAVLISRSSGDGNGDDVRAAVSYDSNPNDVAVLHVEYEVP